MTMRAKHNNNRNESNRVTVKQVVECPQHSHHIQRTTGLMERVNTAQGYGAFIFEEMKSAITTSSTK